MQPRHVPWAPFAVGARARPETHFGVFTTQETCLVTANVVLPDGRANSAPSNPFAGFEPPLRDGEKRSEGKGWEITPIPKFLVLGRGAACC